MEKNTVTISLDDYNELRDIKTNIRKGNIVTLYQNGSISCNYYIFYTEDEALKQFETQNKTLRKKYDETSLKLYECEEKLKQSNKKLEELKEEIKQSKVEQPQIKKQSWKNIFCR